MTSPTGPKRGTYYYCYSSPDYVAMAMAITFIRRRLSLSFSLSLPLSPPQFLLNFYPISSVFSKFHRIISNAITTCENSTQKHDVSSSGALFLSLSLSLSSRDRTEFVVPDMRCEEREEVFPLNSNSGALRIWSAIGAATLCKAVLR